VVRPAYSRVAKWWYGHDMTGRDPDGFRLVDEDGNAKRLEAVGEVDDDDFSECEKEAVDAAWTAVVGLLDDWEGSQKFFHDPNASFIGKAWQMATSARKHAISWNDVIDAYDEFHGTDHVHIKTLMVV
jgi:hypothetical protein